MTAALLLPLAGCSGSGPTVGFYTFVDSDASAMPERCAEFFGDDESVGKRLGVTLYPGPDPEPGLCMYETSDGGQVLLGLSTTKPEGAQLVARGEGAFYAFALSVTSDGSDRPMDADRREDVVSWLEERAGSVEDDFDDWVAALPPVEDGYAAADGYEIDPTSDAEQEPLDGLLRTPNATVEVTSVVRHDYLVVDEEAVSAGEGRDFVVSDLTITQVDDMDVAPTYTIESDGEDLGTGAQEAVAALVETGTGQIALAVPSGAEDVRLVVRTGDLEQAVSLLDGTLHDSGASERLDTAAAGEVAAESTNPRMRDAEGRDLTFYPEQYYSESVGWTLSPWSARDGWAPEGQAYLTLALRPYDSNKAFPLTPADITVTVNGQEHPATSFDPTTYTFHHVVPEGATRVTAQLRISPDPAQLGGPSNWRDGYTLTGPLVYDLAIDPNRSRVSAED